MFVVGLVENEIVLFIEVIVDGIFWFLFWFEVWFEFVDCFVLCFGEVDIVFLEEEVIVEVIVCLIEGVFVVCDVVDLWWFVRVLEVIGKGVEYVMVVVIVVLNVDDEFVCFVEVGYGVVDRSCIWSYFVKVEVVDVVFERLGFVLRLCVVGWRFWFEFEIELLVDIGGCMFEFDGYVWRGFYCMKCVNVCELLELLEW